MKTIIAGGRDIYCYATLKKAIRDSGFNITEVVSGGARGVDKLGERWAEDNLKDCKVFPANWGKYGRGAGPIRNREMALYGDALIAIWNGESKGTKNMIDTARKAGLKVYVHRYTYE